MSSTLTKIALERTSLEQNFLSRQAVSWYQKRVQELKSPINLAREIVREKGRSGQFVIGGLYHFFYDPLSKEKAPYYDMFPLVIPLDRDKEGFLGLNLHYLPPRYRAAFLDKLMSFAVLNGDDEPKRLRVTYDILKTAKTYREFKPCLKRYLDSQIRSKIVPIRPNEWETALFLPTAIFNGATPSKVYTESISKIQGRVV
jgi:hypothetical protein